MKIEYYMDTYTLKFLHVYHSEAKINHKIPITRTYIPAGCHNRFCGWSHIKENLRLSCGRIEQNIAN